MLSEDKLYWTYLEQAVKAMKGSMSKRLGLPVIIVNTGDLRYLQDQDFDQNNHEQFVAIEPGDIVPDVASLTAPTWLKLVVPNWKGDNIAIWANVRRVKLTINWQCKIEHASYSWLLQQMLQQIDSLFASRQLFRFNWLNFDLFGQYKITAPQMTTTTQVSSLDAGEPHAINMPLEAEMHYWSLLRNNQANNGAHPLSPVLPANAIVESWSSNTVRTKLWRGNMPNTPSNPDIIVEVSE